MGISAYVVNHLLEGTYIVSHKSKCGVAVITENTTNFICRVAVVNALLS